MRNTTQPRRILRQVAAVATGLVTFVPIIAGLVYALSPRNWRIPTAGFNTCVAGCFCRSGYPCAGTVCVDANPYEICGCSEVYLRLDGCTECAYECGNAGPIW